MLVRKLAKGQTVELRGSGGELLGFVGITEAGRDRAKLVFHLPRVIGIYPSQVQVADLRGRAAECVAADFAEAVQPAA